MSSASTGPVSPVRRLVRNSNSSDIRRVGATRKGTAQIVACFILFTGHGLILINGAAIVQNTASVWLLLVGLLGVDMMVLAKACRPQTARDRWYHPLLTYLIVAITAMWLILQGIYVDDDQESSQSKDTVQNVITVVDALDVGPTENLDFDTLAYVSVQLITPIILLTGWILPRRPEDLSNDKLSQLLFACLAMAFDIVEFQDNIHHDSLQNKEILSYLILLFSSLSLIQLSQLSQLFAPRMVDSRRWEAFWTSYGVVCQEIPFLSIRIYIMVLEGMRVTELIFPLKNAFSIIFGIYHVYSLLKQRGAQRENRRLSQAGESAPQRDARSEQRSQRKKAFNMTFPLLLLFAHLGLLTWRVVIVHDNLIYCLLSLVALPFILISVPRAVQHRRQLTLEETKSRIWYQPLLLYLLASIACFWLIFLSQIDDNRFLVENTEVFPKAVSHPTSQSYYNVSSSISFSAVFVPTYSTNASSTAVTFGVSSISGLLLTSLSVPKASIIQREQITSTFHKEQIIPSASSVPISLQSSHQTSVVSIGSTIHVSPTVTFLSQSSASPTTFLSQSSASPTEHSWSLPQSLQSHSPSLPQSLQSHSPSLPQSLQSHSPSLPQSLQSHSPSPSPHISDGLVNSTDIEHNGTENNSTLSFQREPELHLGDETSYALVQLVMPLVVFVRWWMPRDGLPHDAFSALLQLALAMAFDISEFTHLLVSVPDLQDHRNLVIIVMIFSSTSLLLLVQLDLGLGSERAWNKIIWTVLSILFLDGPFFIIRVYIMIELDTDAEQFQLVFLLKNLFGVLFGIYSIVIFRKKGTGTSDETKTNVSEPVCEMYTNDATGATVMKGAPQASTFLATNTKSPTTTLQQGVFIPCQGVVIANAAVTSPTTGVNGSLSSYPGSPTTVTLIVNHANGQ